MVLYIESMPRSRPAKVFTAVTEVSYSQRGEYIIYYDAKDRAGNQAEAIAYGMIMEDHVKPVLQLPIESSTIEACDSSQQYISSSDRRFMDLPRMPLTATDNYDDDVSSRLRIHITHLQDVTDVTDYLDQITINTYSLGKHIVSYSASDYADMFGENNEDNVVEQVVVLDVVDRTDPVIVCASDETFVKAGAFAADIPTLAELTVADAAACADECHKQAYTRVIGSVIDVQCELFQLSGTQCTLYGKPAYENRTELIHDHHGVYPEGDHLDNHTAAWLSHTEGDHFHEYMKATAKGLYDNALNANATSVIGYMADCNNFNYHECGVEYTDPGALCVDSHDSFETGVMVLDALTVEKISI